MKRFITAHLALRFLPLLMLGIMTLVEYLFYTGDGRSYRFCCYLLSSAVAFLAYPLTREELSENARFIIPASVYFLIAGFFQKGEESSTYLFVYPSAAMIVAFQIWMVLAKYRKPVELFRKDAVWCYAEEDSRTFYSLVTLALILALLILQFNNILQENCRYLLASLLLLNYVLYMRARSGRTHILNRKKERRIQTLLLSGGNMSEVLPEVENAILAKAYKRIEQFMHDHKPYLDDRMTLERMSELLKINKVYISRAVNKFTSRNFRQYLNWHRVLYSIELMRSDPWLKVIELAFMCGFHSQVTYNMCFKMFMNETPSDMLTRLRLQQPRPEVSTIEVRLPQNEVHPS
ncbi:MAG: helix-turn-helix transcriptional regulator [Bacteroidales bacterium]|nr:helix-turn-helix transcriptional regulator [Bacteroidales bacterium]